ncbi:MAG TPA: protein phosphatase 2C domain-containing protein [Bryobacteraceae bacterium]|nr:protein phosphatase 2C domain-containing protein [Bryobacteraceae bacterium]
MNQSHRGLLFNVAGSIPGGSHAVPEGGLDLEFAELSDPGRVRGHNEDFLGRALPESAARARTHGWLFAVADGVGGQDQGEVASRVAIETLIAGFNQSPAGESHSSLLQRLVQAANVQVYETGRAASPGGTAMATTIVACALRYDRAAIAHVGDSRCYLVRRGKASVLTRDHTVVNDQVRLGVLSTRDAARSEARHVLSRSLGNDLFVGVETSDHQVFPGDVLLLCSDGLHGALEPPDIAGAVARNAPLGDAAARLVALANQRDGGDNISVQLIRVRSVERVGMYRGRPYKLR